MTIRPNEFYEKLGEFCNDDIVGLFYELTSYYLHTIRQDSVDDVEYEFFEFDKNMYMLIIGIEDSVLIEIHFEGIIKGNAVVYVEYSIRRQNLETPGKREAGYDAKQWEMNSDSCRLIESQNCKSRNHSAETKKIMTSWRNKIKRRCNYEEKNS